MLYNKNIETMANNYQLQQLSKKYNYDIIKSNTRLNLEDLELKEFQNSIEDEDFDFDWSEEFDGEYKTEDKKPKEKENE